MVSLAVGALLGSAGTEAQAGRPIENGGIPGENPAAEAIDLDNFGLLPRWIEPVRILRRSDERLRSLAVFRLSQVIAPQAEDPADQDAVEKPAYRVRLPQMREPDPEPVQTSEPGAEEEPSVAALADTATENGATTPRSFRPARLDIRERDLSERPNLLQPSVGPWLGDAGMVPIQTQAPALPQVIPPPIMPPAPGIPAPLAQPQVIPPPIMPPGPEIPAPPATVDLPKPELFPSTDSPTNPFAIPWEMSRGSGVAPTPGEMPEAEPEPEPEAEPKPEAPEELKLRQPTSAWDFGELEGPLFGTEDIAEFTRKISGSGSWKMRPHFSMTTLYDGNVFLEDEGKEGDFIISVSPGVTARVGNESTPLYLVADYTLGAVFFAENDDENSINHNGALKLDWKGSRTSLALRLGVENDSGTSIDATDRVRRTSYKLGVDSHFAYSDKVSFDFAADYRRAYYEDLIGSQDYGAQAYVNYHYSPKVSIGLGAGFSIAEVEDGRTQHSQNVSMRANWVATGKLTVEGRLGVGFYQFDSDEDDGVSPIASLRATYVATGKLTFSGDISAGVNRFDASADSISPTFNLDATWAVREGTVITFNGHRSIFNSVVLTDQNYTSTGVIVGLRQQLGIRFTAYVTASYENLEYTSEASDVDATRQDDYIFARFGLQWHAFNRCSFGLFYEFSQNSSEGEDARNFRRDRTGAQVSVLF